MQNAKYKMQSQSFNRKRAKSMLAARFELGSIEVWDLYLSVELTHSIRAHPSSSWSFELKRREKERGTRSWRKKKKKFFFLSFLTCADAEADRNSEQNIHPFNTHSHLESEREQMRGKNFSSKKEKERKREDNKGPVGYVRGKKASDECVRTSLVTLSSLAPAD